MAMHAMASGADKMLVQRLADTCGCSMPGFLRLLWRSAWTMPMATMIRPMTMTTVEASMALNCTDRSHHGTPKEDTYHQAFQPAKEIAMRKTTEATAKVRARGERIAICDKTTAPRAAITPAIPA